MGPDMQTFRRNAMHLTEFMPPLLQATAVVIVTVLMIYLAPQRRQLRALVIGVIAGGAYLAANSTMQSLRSYFRARNEMIELNNQELRVTDWRGRSHELNWNDVEVVRETSRIQLDWMAAGTRHSIVVGARDFENGYQLISLILQYASRPDDRTIQIIPFPEEPS